MVLLIIIPMKNGYFIGNINPTFSDKPISNYIRLWMFSVLFNKLWIVAPEKTGFIRYKNHHIWPYFGGSREVTSAPAGRDVQWSKVGSQSFF